jgi:hypothetical protein
MEMRLDPDLVDLRRAPECRNDRGVVTWEAFKATLVKYQSGLNPLLYKIENMKE